MPAAPRSASAIVVVQLAIHRECPALFVLLRGRRPLPVQRRTAAGPAQLPHTRSASCRRVAVLLRTTESRRARERSRRAAKCRRGRRWRRSSAESHAAADTAGRAGTERADERRKRRRLTENAPVPQRMSPQLCSPQLRRHPRHRPHSAERNMSGRRRRCSRVPLCSPRPLRAPVPAVPRAHWQCRQSRACRPPRRGR